MSVLKNLQSVQENIQFACQKSGREMDEITIVAVTKYVDLARMKEALQAGLDHVGESKVQDAVKKWNQLEGRGEWHFIGHLQTNKVRDMIDKFDFIHSLDRPSLAKEIEKKAQAIDKTISCFVQVNISGEESKHGIEPEKVEAFIEELSAFPHIRVIGLMTMAPFFDDPENTRPVFRRLKELQHQLRGKKWAHAPLTELSMGMSSDYIIAVEEGATFIRLGSTLVGE